MSLYSFHSIKNRVIDNMYYALCTTRSNKYFERILVKHILVKKNVIYSL